MAERLHIGEWYIVRYHAPGDRKDRVMTARYMGWSRFYTKHEFDLRPKAGTQSIAGDWIKDVQRADEMDPKLPVVAE